MNIDLARIQFKTTVFQSKSRYHSVQLEPIHKQEVINHFFITYRKSKSVKTLIQQLIDGKNHTELNKKYIGINESHIYAFKDSAIFDMELVTELKPINLNLDNAIQLFEMYYEYLIKYENCEIPGLIPEEKLDTFEISKKVT